MLSIILALALILAPSQEVGRRRTLYPSGGGGSIAFDAVCSGCSSSAVQTSAASTTISWTHVVGGGSHPVLLVMLYKNSGTWTCTYNSVSMTQLGIQADGAGAEQTALFILVGPATGSHTVSCTSSVNNDLEGGSISFTGVNQTGTAGTSWRSSPPCVNDGGSGTSSISNTVSNAANGDMVVDTAVVFNNPSTTTMTKGASQTLGFYQHNALGNTQETGASYLSATGSTTMTWSITASSFWASCAVALIPG
jgi:hypothetical protein